MKQVTTIICSLLFVIAGAMIINFKPTPQPYIFPGSMTAYAQPKIFNPDEIKLPLDVQLGLNKRTTTETTAPIKRDTVYLHDTVSVTKTKFITKRQKVAVPEVVEVHDTLCVPVFFLATPLEYEVESTEIIPITEVQSYERSETNQTSEEQGEQ